MSASNGRLDLSQSLHSDPDAPQVEALFLIKFDKKVGYTITWHRTVSPTLSLAGVEYKSLPSGLHALASDLVYFTHEGYAGLSAFAKGAAAAEDRNARFVSVGILVRREGSVGRLGRGWLLASRLEALARAVAEGGEGETALVEEFWAEVRAREENGEENGSGNAIKGHSRARAISTVSAVLKDDETLPAYHPALAMLKYVEVLGPLVFRLQQAALLRKRILFVGIPPVRRMCEFVYNLSVLSSISPRDAALLLPGTESLLRLPTLFSVGVHDIPLLEPPKHGGHTPGNDPPEGWAACTTDEIIATKAKLYDIIVELPHTYDAPPEQRRWPRIRTSDGSQIKASQRDVARYKLLHRELFKHRSRAQSNETYTDDANEPEDDAAPLISRDEVDTKRADDEYNEVYDDSVVEPMTWSRLAYLGFMWWASAGERDAYTTAERDLDRELLGDLGDFAASTIETALIAYFHRQSAVLIQGLAGLVDNENEDGEDEAEEGEALVIDRDDLARLGLDTWSEADRAFVYEFGMMYFGRRVEVRGNEVDCCGLRVPVF